MNGLGVPSRFSIAVLFIPMKNLKISLDHNDLKCSWPLHSYLLKDEYRNIIFLDIFLYPLEHLVEVVKMFFHSCKKLMKPDQEFFIALLLLSLSHCTDFSFVSLILEIYKMYKKD